MMSYDQSAYPEYTWAEDRRHLSHFCPDPEHCDNHVEDGGMMSYVYHNLPWAGLFQRRCKSRFGTKWYRGSCELRPRHAGDHAAERGMEWVRWNDDDLWFTTPGSKEQGRPV